MDSRKIRKAGAVAIALLVLISVGSQIYMARRRSVVTETAAYASVSDTLQAKGFAVRQEAVIDEAYNGMLSYRVSDGARVAAGETIADVYASESHAAAQNRIDGIEREIQNLEGLTSPGDYSVANPSLIGAQIYTALGDILDETRKNNFSQITSLKENLQTALNRKQLITGEESTEDYKARIADLEAQKMTLSASAGEKIDSISAPQAGYFMSVTDGFENAVDFEHVPYLTPSEIEQLQQKEESGESMSLTPIGKVSGDFNWYLACVFSDEDMMKFENVTNVSLEIPFASTEQIPAAVIAKNRDNSSGKTAVIFQCSYMDAGIALLRNESVQINVKTYSGVLVKKEAIHFEDVEYEVYDEEGEAVLNESGEPVTAVAKDVKGVYVKYGGRLKFVQIFSEKTVRGYAICKTQLSDEEQEQLVTDGTIQLYDEVVTEGTDLHDGKLVE